MIDQLVVSEIRQENGPVGRYRNEVRVEEIFIYLTIKSRVYNDTGKQSLSL